MYPGGGGGRAEHDLSVAPYGGGGDRRRRPESEAAVEATRGSGELGIERERSEGSGRSGRTGAFDPTRS